MIAVEYLLDAGADMYAVDLESVSPVNILDSLLASKHSDAVSLLRIFFYF